MHSVIFVVEKPVMDPIGQEPGRWHELKDTLDHTVEIFPNCTRLAENILQIPLNNGMPSLIRCGEACRVGNYTYKVLFFSDAPEWIVSSTSEE